MLTVKTANTKEGCGTFVDGNSTGSSVICLSPPKNKMLADADAEAVLKPPFTRYMLHISVLHHGQ